MNKDYTILWSYQAKESLDNIYKYIKNNSLQNARKVKNKIITTVNDLIIFPEKFPREPVFDKTKGNFRFAVVFSYKIIYELTEEKIIVLDIFNTAQNPIKIENLIN